MICRVTSCDHMIKGHITLWKPLTLRHHFAKVYVYTSYGSRDLKFSFYHVTSRDQMIKGPYDLVSWSPHPKSPTIFRIYRSFKSGDETFLLCYV